MAGSSASVPDQIVGIIGKVGTINVLDSRYVSDYSIRTMHRQTTDSRLTLAILGLLSVRPMTGYALRKVFQTTAMRMFSSSPGAIYPALRRLERDGRVEGVIEREDTLRPRKVFSLSLHGRETFVESLTQPVTSEDIVQRMDSLLLRFSFMSGLIEEKEIAVFLKDFSKETDAYLGVLEEELREHAPGLSYSSRTAQELSVEIFRTKVRWARESLGNLQERNLILEEKDEE